MSLKTWIGVLMIIVPAVIVIAKVIWDDHKRGDHEIIVALGITLWITAAFCLIAYGSHP